MTIHNIVQGSAFVGGEPPSGLGARFHFVEGVARLEYVIGATLEGPPGHAHGGALAALLDEAMGAAAWLGGYRVLAVHLSFDYRRPVAVGATVQVTGEVERSEGRKVFTRGAITLADGALAVEAHGVFVEAPQFFTAPGFSLSVDHEEMTNLDV